VATRAGSTRDVALNALTVPEYQRLLPFSSFIPAPQGMPRKRQPLYQRLGGRRYGITPLERGRAVYAAYNQTTYPGLIPSRLLRLARKPKVRRVVIDLRLNGGGDNTSYGSLLAALRSRTINRPGKLVVLTSRVTFSAAGNFAADVDRSTRARFFGEPTGGSPNNYGESQEIDLPTLGVTVFTATQWVEVAPGDTRLAIEPDVPVPLTAADYFAGRDPVLAAALR
jgi:Peptidase family S41